MIIALTEQFIDAVVELHETVLGDTLNARIGPWFLRHLYRQIVQHQPNSFGFIYVEDNTVLGFISGCVDYTSLSATMLQSISLVEKIKLAGFFCTHPRSIHSLIEQQAFGKYLQTLLPQPHPYILTLGVSSATQGKGIGQQLMTQAKTFVQQQHCATIYLDTKEKNTQALRFYQKNGFTEMARQYGNVVLCSPT